MHPHPGTVERPTPKLVDTQVRQPLRAGPAGRYTVIWGATSADAHPVAGAFKFTTIPAAGRAVGRRLVPLLLSRADLRTTAHVTGGWGRGVVYVRILLPRNQDGAPVTGGAISTRALQAWLGPAYRDAAGVAQTIADTVATRRSGGG